MSEIDRDIIRSKLFYKGDSIICIKKGESLKSVKNDDIEIGFVYKEKIYEDSFLGICAFNKENNKKIFVDLNPEYYNFHSCRLVIFEKRIVNL